MATILDVYRTIDAMKNEGVVRNYAIGGGMAALFYCETTPTFDVDVFVSLEQEGLLIDLSPLYNWARAQGFEVRDEYLLLHGVPVQVLVANGGLETEAIEQAEPKGGAKVHVMRPEYLIALYIQTGGDKRRGRARDLFAEGTVNEERLQDVLSRYGLAERWKVVGGSS